MKSPNGSAASVSPEVAGITATLFALSQLAHSAAAAHVYQRLLRYAIRQPEARELRRRID
jgi:hypothetical protein